MRPEESGMEWPRALAAIGSWQTTVMVGAVTLILGLIVCFHPTDALNVIAVLLGVLMIISGLFHLIKMFNSSEAHRVWMGISGLRPVGADRCLFWQLAVLIGIWFVIAGLFEIFDGFLLRHMIRKSRTTIVNPPRSDQGAAATG